MPESRDVTILNPQGLHARPASLIVRTTNGFTSEVTLKIRGEMANCKSIMEVMMLASPQGTTAILEAEGPDADAVLDALQKLFSDGFGEAYS